jgi:hypothetical protein
MNGWWNSLTGADFDSDGDIDYVAGNLGLNSRYKASPEQPVCIYAKDYDGNGRMDPVLCHYIEGEQRPAHPRDVLISQIVGMRGRFLNYADYGKATYETMFSEEERKDAFVVRGQRFASSYLENLGNGKFAVRDLPMPAQVTPIYGMLAEDFDGDGHTDLLLAGNSYAPETLTGWYDAGIGLYMRGDGKGNFQPVPATRSGFFADKDAKGMAQLITPEGKRSIIVSNNNDQLQAFSPRSESAAVCVQLTTLENNLLITYPNGQKQRREVYYGSGYLSASSRRLVIPSGAASVKLTDYLGRSREVKSSSPVALQQRQ